MTPRIIAGFALMLLVFVSFKYITKAAIVQREKSFVSIVPDMERAVMQWIGSRPESAPEHKVIKNLQIPKAMPRFDLIFGRRRENGTATLRFFIPSTRCGYLFDSASETSAEFKLDNDDLVVRPLTNQWWSFCSK